MTGTFRDFRGGYVTSRPNHLMLDSELHKAQDCQWRGELKKRNGLVKYSTSDWAAFTSGCKGGIRAYINGGWYTVVALDDGSDVNFYYGTTTTFTAIDNTFDWTTGQNVEMAYLNGYIVAVNGTDKPAVIYYSSGWVVKNLEELDTRTRDDSSWYAGQYTTATATFTDDTTDAQDAGADDFQVGNTTNNDGCFVSCTMPFTKVTFKSVQQAGGSPVATYKYWNGTAWAAVTTVSAPTWTAAEGDKDLEFNIPLDSDGALLWSTYAESTSEHLSNKYILLIQFSTAASGAFSADELEVYHTQYLTQIMENDKPKHVVTHGNRVHMSAGNVMNISPYNAVTGWRAGEVDYFAEGGQEILAMISHADYLAVFKAGTIYSFSGNSYQNWVRSDPLTTVGTTSGRSVAMVGGFLFFVGRDGIYAFDGKEATKVSKHIQSDIDSWTLTDACAVRYQNEYWVSFPTNSVTLTADPDTFRRDDAGDVAVSFFKFTTYKVSQFIYNFGDGDNGYLLGIVSGNPPYIARCDNGTQDNLAGTATNITMTARTKYYDGKDPMTEDFYKRVRLMLKQVTATAGRSHTVMLYGEHGTVTASQTVKPAVGSGYDVFALSVPYKMDGQNIGVEITHSGSTSAAVAGVSFLSDRRAF